MVSVIIPIRRGEIITDTVTAVEKSTYKNIEIIIVDENLERSEQRNIGIKKTRGEFVLILDSDQQVHRHLISEAIYKCIYERCDALYIPEIIKTKGYFAYVRNWERQFYTATPIDVVRFVRKDRVPEFAVDLVGPEDADWDRRIKGKRGITDWPLYHYDNVNIIEYFKKKAYYAKSMRKYKDRHPKDIVLTWWWRCFWVFMEQGKWKTFLRRPDLILAVMFTILVRGLIYEIVIHAESV